MDATDSQIRKALVALAIERVLIRMGDFVLNEVAGRLYNDYKCYIPDCNEHPEYLKAVLQDLYGASHVTIVQSIKENLEKFAYQKPIEKFLTVIGG